MIDYQEALSAILGAVEPVPTRTVSLEDALGEVVCVLEEDSKSVSGHGADTDVIIASAKAYINALNKLAARKK